MVSQAMSRYSWATMTRITQAMKEIIFPIRQDGKKTQEYSGSTYLVASMRISGMPNSFTSNYWSCNFARKDLVEKFFPKDNIPMAGERRCIEGCHRGAGYR